MAPTPALLDLPGPSRRITVDPLRLPEPARQPVPHEPAPAGPHEPAPEVEPVAPEPPAREPAPA